MFLASLFGLVSLAHADVCTDHVFTDVFGHGGAPGAGLSYVLADFVGVEDYAFGFRVFVVHVDVGDVVGEFFVGFSRGGIEHEEEDVEAGEEGRWEVDVFDGGDARVVATIEGISCC